MMTRLISALVAIALLIFVLFNGGTTLFIVSALVSLIGIREFYRAYGSRFRPIPWVGYLLTLLVYAGFYFGTQGQFYTFCFIVSLQLLLAISVFTDHRMIDSIITYVGFFYVSFPILHINMLYRFEKLAFVWLPFVIAVSTDVFAYVCGRLFGRHKLIPRVSPNKTVEGAIGALVMCALLTTLYACVYLPDPLYYIPLGIIGSVASQVGDLIASRIKRDCDIKDFGRIMPGHGGVLDRLDSLLVVVPLVFYYSYFVQMMKGAL